jgi:hypothetical protein
MPYLVCREDTGTLLESNYAAVLTPDGIQSFSAFHGVFRIGYSGVDFERTYQYHSAFLDWG